MKKGNW